MVDHSMKISTICDSHEKGNSKLGIIRKETEMDIII